MSRLSVLCLLAFAPLLVPTSADAGALIVKKDGTCIVAESAATRDDTVEYELRSSNGVKTLPRDAVDVIIPTHERGQMDPIETVDAALEDLTRCATEYPQSAREFESQKARWMVLKKQYDQAASRAGELKDKLDAQLARYTVSERTPDDYAMISSELDLIGMRDMNGTLKADIEKAKKAMLADFQDLNFKRLAVLAADDDATSIPQTLRILKLGEGILAWGAPKGRAAEINTIMDYARWRCYERNLTAALKVVGATPTVDDYLQIGSQLRELSRQIARKGQKRQISALFAEVDERFQTANPDYDVHVNGLIGYPITKVDTQTMMAVSSMVSSNDNREQPPYSPIMVMMPQAKVPALPVAAEYTTTFLVIAKAPPPANAAYRLVFNFQEENIAVELPESLSFVNAHAEFTATYSFKTLKKSTLKKLGDESWNGNSYVLSRLEYRPVGSALPSDWRPLTHYMTLEFSLK